MATRYIEINSTFRNRTNFPLQSDFVVTSTINNSSVKLDPVCDQIAYEINSVQTTAINTSYVILSATSSSINNFHLNSYIYTQSVFRRITAYDGSTKRADVTPTLPIASVSTDYYNIRRQLPSVSTTVGGSVISDSVFNLTDGITFTSQMLARFVTGGNADEFTTIVGYVPATKIITVSPAFPSTPIGGDEIEILSNIRENVSPLVSSDSNSWNSASLVELDLISLTVPSATIGVSYGGTAINYPFFYVELFAEGSTAASNLIYSNNPVATQASFRVEINNYAPSTGSFFTFSGQMAQRVTFRLTDALRFRVRLPDGNLLQFSTVDLLSPFPPNPLLQINALFSIRRL